MHGGIHGTCAFVVTGPLNSFHAHDIVNITYKGVDKLNGYGCSAIFVFPFSTIDRPLETREENVKQV